MVCLSVQVLFAAEVVVSPPYVFIPSVKSQLRPEIQVAAQNCWVKKGGAYTGEVRLVLHFLLPFSYLCICICHICSSDT
jgi:triosephosphate isomerase